MHPTRDREGTGLRRGLPLIIAGAVLAVGLGVWRPTPVGLVHDDGVYVLVGKSLADGRGLVYGGVAGTPPAAKFPPVYPFTLAALWTAFPTFPSNVVAFEIANLLFLAAAAGLFTAFQIGALGVPPLLAGGVSALGFVSIEIWRVAVVPLSEPFFILLTILALMCATRLETSARPSPWAWGAAVALLWLVMHTRTAGGVLILAAVGALAARRRYAFAGAVAAVTAVLALPWMLWSRQAVGKIPAPLRDVLGPYAPWIVEQIRANPRAFLERLPAEASSLLAHLVTVLLPGLTPSVRVVAVVTSIPILVMGIRWLWETSRTSALVAPLYLLLLWLWPFKEFRLLAPILPILALLLGCGALGIWRSGIRPEWRRVGVALAVVWAAWFSGQSVRGLVTGAHMEGLGQQSRVLADAVAAVRAETPPDAVVGAPDAWAGIGLYTGRRVAPSARFLPLSTVGPVWGTPDQQIELWAQSRLEYLVLEHGGVVHGEALEELARRCGPESVREVRALSAGASLVRLTLSGACVADRPPGGGS